MLLSVNDPLTDNDAGPFGGMKFSGGARELGEEGLKPSWKPNTFTGISLWSARAGGIRMAQRRATSNQPFALLQREPQVRRVWLILLCLLVAACTSEAAPAPATPLPVSTPPAVQTDNVLSAYRTAVNQPSLGASAATPLTVGRPMLAGGLSIADVRAYRPGQRIDQLVRTTGEWHVPILSGRAFVGSAHLDARGEVQGAGGIPPNAQSPTISASYDDPTADVWLIGVGPPPIVSLLLIRRGTDERLAFYTEGSQPFFPFLDQAAGREVSPEEMMPLLRRAVEEHCTIFLFIKQC